MSFDSVVSFISPEGNQYDILFSKLNEDIIPVVSPIPIIEVSIVTEDHKNINSFATLSKIALTIKQYMNDHDVILYSYCDSKEIKRSLNRLNLAPQQYRSMFFSSLFEKYKGLELDNKVIVINDKENGNHYIHLISDIRHADLVERLTDNLLTFDK